ncbi:MAG: DUF2851 family protein [Verrucomicrobia bacterium]|nr:DUF2851 family protein [Verrucomicrobiota bacterium]
MSIPSPGLYAELRSQFVRPTALHEAGDFPPEQLLQAIWQHQRLRRDRLKTADGQPLFILHPGFLNREAGPDFRGAVIQIGGASPQTGDVEIDPQPADWRHHQHENNPAYANVVLHVVWKASAAGSDPSGLPLLELEPVLDDSLVSLADWLHQETPPAPPAFLAGRCASTLRELDSDRLESLLTQAALVRLQNRADRFTARARDAGWTQALWEGLFRALGYKHNAWPMLRLAELRNRWHKPDAAPTEITARLLGLGGLLPSELPGANRESCRYLGRLWDCWWREQDAFSDCTLPAGAWRFSGIRPANHPQRRLALAAQWSCENALPSRLREWSRDSGADARLQDSLLKVLQPRTDPFWSRTCTLRSRPAAKPIPLLGRDRITDLAGNVVLPWLWAQARQGRRARLQAEMQRRYLAWPTGSDNAVLKVARQRLLGSRRRALPRGMAMQQGLHQIVQDFCNHSNHSNSLCDGCRFPELARRFVVQ